jgi:hypothetical protein
MRFMTNYEYKYGEKVYSRWCTKNKHLAFRYRCDSVPFIHSYGHGGWYSNPRTRFEEINNYIADEDDKALLTPHQIQQVEKYRNNLPDSWDEKPRARRGDSWKNYRKTRYK